MEIVRLDHGASVVDEKETDTCQILNFATNPRQSNSVQGTELNWGGGTDTAQKKCIPGGGDTAHIF